MTLLSRLPALVVVLASLATARAASDDSATLLARFRTEGPEGWARLEKYDDEFTYTAAVTSTDTIFKDNRQVIRGTVYSWARRPGCLRLETRELRGKNAGRTTVSVYTDKHLFEVRRPTDGGADWQLVHSGAIQKNTDIRFMLRSSMIIVRPTTTFTVGTFCRCLDLSGNSNIVFEKARAVEDGIGIDFHASGKNLLNEPFDTRGSVVFDPANCWAVRSYQYAWSDGYRVAVVNTFGEPDPGGIRRIASRQDNSYASHGTVSTKVAYESTKTGPAAPEQFRLAAFGLPDPLGPLPSRFPTVYVLVGAAVAFGIAALWFRRRARRARQVAAAGLTA